MLLSLMAELQHHLPFVRRARAGSMLIRPQRLFICVFDIRASSLPEYYKERLLAASHHLISSDGVIVIKAQEYRSQELNREAALARLVAVIKDLTTEQKARRPTRPTRASKERRLASKAQKSSVKAMRGKVRSGRE